MHNPLVSVIIPNYNHAKYLQQRIDSVLKQTYENYEIIILDDNSTDNSIDIINKYKNNPHVSHIVLNEINSNNPFIQWSKGIEMAKGELIWIAESDDYASSDFLYILVNQIKKNPNAILAFSHSYLIDSDDCIININPHKNSGNSIVVHRGNVFAKDVLTNGNYIYNASMVIFKRSAYSNIKEKTYQHFRSCGDWLFWMNLCLQGEVIEVCTKLNYFRQHQNRVTVKAGKTGNDWNEVAVILSLFINLLNIKGKSLRKFRGKWTNDLLLSNNQNKHYFIQNFNNVFGGSKIDILIYKFSKLYHKFFGLL